MDRADLERRVDELAELHSGQAFADAIKALAADLNSDEEELLKQILLERGANFDKAVMDRVDARSWYQRQWDKASAGSRAVRQAATAAGPTRSPSRAKVCATASATGSNSAAGQTKMSFSSIRPARAPWSVRVARAGQHGLGVAPRPQLLRRAEVASPRAADAGREPRRKL